MHHALQLGPKYNRMSQLGAKSAVVDLHSKISVTFPNTSLSSQGFWENLAKGRVARALEKSWIHIWNRFR